MTTILITATGAGSQARPGDWQNAGAVCHVIGGGGGGSGGSASAQGAGAGGGAYSNLSSFTMAATIFYNIGVGGTAGGPNANGTIGGDSWIRIDGTNAAPTTTAQGTLAKAGGPGLVTPAGGAGGAAASGVGTVTKSGGAGATSSNAGAGGTGGGGAGGAQGNGGPSVADTGGSIGATGGGGSGGGGSGTVGGSGVTNSTINGGNGGNNAAGTGVVGGGGAGGTAPAAGGTGTLGAGGGGGGGKTTTTGTAGAGGVGGLGQDYDSTHGSGGGGGGGGGSTAATTTGGKGGNGGLYGGGGGAGGSAPTNATGGTGGQGIGVIIYTPTGGNNPFTIDPEGYKLPLQYLIPYSIDETWIDQGLNLLPIPTVLTQTLRAKQTFPNPQPVTWYQNWIQQGVRTTPQNPFSQSNWPNPQPISWYQTWTQWTNPTPTPGNISVMEWNLVPGPQQPIQTWVYNQTIYLGPVLKPFNQSYWPNPQPITWYRDWNEDLLQTTLKPVFQAPFFQTDWPLPSAYIPIQQWWAEAGNVQLPFPTPFFQRINAPLPVISQPIDATWIQNLSEFLQANTFPFSQKDWPLPYPIQWYKDWYQALAVYFPTVFPTRQSDYPNPRTYVPIDQFWSNNLNLLPTISTTKPFNQNDWPLPRDYQRIDENFLQSLALILPPPPPPIEILSAGHQWTEQDVLRHWMAAIGKVGRSVRYAPKV